MKNKKLKGKLYARLIRKLFYQTMVILAAAAALVLILRTVGRGYFGNWITSLISMFFDISFDRALIVYHVYIRSNIDAIVTAAIIAFFIILFRISLTWFTRYFDEIVAGVDQLAEESKYKIAMSPELGFMAEKLNQVKSRLESRTREVQEAEQRKNDLVVYLAHDIKTPLTSVIGYLSLLSETPDMPKEQNVKYIRITLDKAYRLESLINEFFEITRYHLQTVPLKKEQVDLYYMLVQMADEAFPQLTASGGRIDIHAPEDMIVYGDADKLARVFNNLLKNAIAYGDRGGVIQVLAEKQERNTVIRFENPGTIPRDKLGSIFEKFYRLDNARSTSTGGAGLGLAIARDIVVLHGGTIGAESDEAHTVFTVTLPNIT